MSLHIQNNLLMNLESEYERSIDLFDKCIRYAMGDISVIGTDTEGFGEIVVLYATDGKIALLGQLLEGNEVAAGLRKDIQYHNLRAKWNAFLGAHRAEVSISLKEQFNNSVLLRYETDVKHKRALESSWDFELFLLFRDIVELFYLGVNKDFNVTEYRESISHFEEEIKNYIVIELLPKAHEIWSREVSKPQLRSNKEKEIWLMEFLDSTNRSFLPANFWWRHLRVDRKYEE